MPPRPDVARTSDRHPPHLTRVLTSAATRTGYRGPGGSGRHHLHGRLARRQLSTAGDNLGLTQGGTPEPTGRAATTRRTTVGLGPPNGLPPTPSHRPEDPLGGPVGELEDVPDWPLQPVSQLR